MWLITYSIQQTNEKRPRESILRMEFANAIEAINKDLTDENRLKFLHWDLHKHSRRYITVIFMERLLMFVEYPSHFAFFSLLSISKATNVLMLLGKVAAYALSLTGFFYCEVTPALLSQHLKWPAFE